MHYWRVRLCRAVASEGFPGREGRGSPITRNRCTWRRPPTESILGERTLPPAYPSMARLVSSLMNQRMFGLVFTVAPRPLSYLLAQMLPIRRSSRPKYRLRSQATQGVGPRGRTGEVPAGLVPVEPMIGVQDGTQSWHGARGTRGERFARTSLQRGLVCLPCPCRQPAISRSTGARPVGAWEPTAHSWSVGARYRPSLPTSHSSLMMSTVRSARIRPPSGPTGLLAGIEP